jgi:Tfp pilus assembly protein PilN
MEKIVSPFEFSSIEKTALALKAEQEKLDYEQQRIDKLKEITSNVVTLMEQFTEISNETYDPANRTDYNPNANN